MQPAIVLGSTRSTVKHESFEGQKLVVIQPLGLGDAADGPPLIAVDALGSRAGDRVLVTSDGTYAREVTGHQSTPGALERDGDCGLKPMSHGVEIQNETRNNAQTAGADLVIDSDQVRAIVREVIRRLQCEHSTEDDTQPTILDRVVTAQSIQRLKEGIHQVTVHTNAIVTPAARDLARERGVTLQRTETLNIQQRNQTSKDSDDQLIDTDSQERAKTVLAQLQHRGVSKLNTRILLTEAPAATVVREVKQGEVAVMISTLDQVERFAAECQPTSWVLDMKRLNLMAAVNVAARIAKLPRNPS